MGFPRVADIVVTHMDVSVPEDATMSETEVVFLADKLVQSDRIVSLDRRYQAAMDRFSDDPEMMKSVENRKRNAVFVKERIESRIGCPLENVLTKYIEKTAPDYHQ